MKQWKCTVCGYIHTGDTPPETCPVCGASKNKFILHEVETTEAPEANAKRLEDVTVDIVVVGSGAGGLSAAATATHNNASVVVLEKARKPGGTTRRSGGRYWIPNNYAQKEMGIADEKEKALEYMARYSFPTEFDGEKENFGLYEYDYGLLESFYDTGSKVIDLYREIGIFETAVDLNWQGKPHVDYMQNLPENHDIRGRSLYAVTEKGPEASGADLIDLFITWLEHRDVTVHTNHEVTKALTNATGQVVGVEANTPDGVRKFYGTKGVVFATGGFSHNHDLIKRFHANPLVGGCAVPENTGELISISESLGAMLGNMTSAFRVQSIHEAYLANPEGASSTFYFVGDSFLEVNKYGQRVVNEKRNYNDRTKVHYVWDPIKAEYPNQYLFFIFDQRTAQYWGGFPPYPVGDPTQANYIIAGEDLENLATEIGSRLALLKDELNGFSLEPEFAENLKATVERFNEFARSGKDLDFQRGEYDYDVEYASLPPFVPEVSWPEEGYNGSMYPLSEQGPYYAMILAPGSLETNGGPMINEHSQLLATGYQPIEGIYGAGNCVAAPGKNAYWGAGATIGPAMVHGYRAVNHALNTKDKKK